MTRIEYLPNEIFYECFKYLYGQEILYSFEQLNSRFNRLIRSIPLNVNFGNIHRLTFAQISNKISTDEKLREQIYSLHLSNRNIHNQIQQFLTLFSFDKFPNLRSLSLTEVKPNDISRLESMLPMISNLNSFKLFHTTDKLERLFCALSNLHLRTLIFPRLYSYFKSNNESLSITKLIIAQCGLYHVNQFMGNIPNLKYFKIEQFYRTHDIWDYQKNVSRDHFMVQLKDLIIMCCEDQFKGLASILKKTPNLINLTIVTHRNVDKDMINADLWESLINSLLPYLNSFKFLFQCPDWCDRNLIEIELTKFQSDFWCEQHQWYTEYTFAKNLAEIYTIPYLLNTYELRSNIEKYSNHQLDNTQHTFRNVTHLTTVYSNILMENCRLYFSHVTSIRLEMIFESTELRINSNELKMIVHLSNVKHLIIPGYIGIEALSTLFELLIEMSQLSSLNIRSNTLKGLFQNNDLCKYFNEKITKLNLTDTSDCSIDNSFDLKQFCQIFSNLEELQCNIDQYDSFLFLLKFLPKLSYINVFSFQFTCDTNIDRLEEHQVGGRTVRDFHHNKSKYFSIWFM